MRSFFLLIISCFLLVACSSTQATVLPAVTSTAPPPTETPIPTPTVNPAFLAIQEQVAGAGQDYSIMSNGDIQAKRPDGTIGVIPGIKLNQDGKGYTIVVNGAEVTIDTDKVSITDGGIKVDGYAYDSANLGFDKIVVYDSATWSAMDQTARDEALAQLPATTDEGYTRGGFSTVEGMSHHVIYYGANGDYAGSQNLLTGKFEKTGTGAIEVFRTEEGGYYEMRAFGFEGMNEEQAKKAAEEMLYEAIVVDGVTYGEFSLFTAPNTEEFLLRLRKINELKDKASVSSHIRMSDASLMNFAGFELDGGMAFVYRSDDGMRNGYWLRDTRPADFNNKAQMSAEDGGYVIPVKPVN